VPEQSLHPHRGPGHPVADQRLPPQGELLPGGAHDLVRQQLQRDDAALGVLVGRRGRLASGELPADPFGYRGRGQ
jgi:hypothetical protein